MGLLSRLLGKSDEPRVAEPAVRTVTPRNDRAVVYRSEYLPPDKEAAVFVLGRGAFRAGDQVGAVLPLAGGLVLVEGVRLDAGGEVPSVLETRA